ncbi:hypothetical protein HK104_004706, partial [Borealophlyctis nickersoniae]
MFQEITDDTAYIMPVSDDGGSTSEIVRMVGGPGIGDIRSRLVRLAETKSAEAKAVYALLSHRLPIDDGSPPGVTAKSEWLDIVEGCHPLWQGISHPFRETIRAFLAHFHHEIVRCTARRGPFDFRGGSIGNFFISGSRLFFSNLDAAIFQFTRITRIPPRTEVLPVLCASTHGTHTIAASLRNGHIIVGQCDISHPGQVIPDTAPKSRRTSSLLAIESKKPLRTPTSLSPAAIPMLRTPSGNIMFSKIDRSPPLPSPIRRVYYINTEKQETFPDLNPLVASHLTRKQTIIYGCGSLYTSIIPCLIVPGVGRLLADRPSNTHTQRFSHTHNTNHTLQPRAKLLLLNGTHDRETRTYTALDVILAITDALNFSCLAEDRDANGGVDAIRRRVATRTAAQDMDGAVH